MEGGRIGVITRGSLSKGLELKLDPEVPLEDLRSGMFAVAEGERFDFVSLITDMELNSATPEALDAPPPGRDSLLRYALAGDSIYARVNLRPHLMVDHRAAEAEKRLQPVKTIPGHFTEVRRATPEDVELIFGKEDGASANFHIGTPVDMEEIPVCVNLERFAERSNGIFGKSGTGKTFVTRLILCGLVKSGAAVNLVFDMHGEYGWKGTDEGSGGSTKGLLPLFGESKVQIFTLDPRPAVNKALPIRIPYSFIEIEDILSLRKVLNLPGTAEDNLHILHRRFGESWFASALEMDTRQVAEEEDAHDQSIKAFRRRLARLQQQCQGFLKPDHQANEGGITEILKNLERGVHTIIDFGRYNSLLHYILVANILTRRIDKEWREKMEAHQSDDKKHPPPPRVVITIEEAHKFLEPGIADQTIFGKIARELRKYNVTLLVVDQRPSQIEREVLSQLGTKICCLLDDEQDVEAVLAGTSGSGGLKSVLASLDSKQQALVFGHAVPMPVALRTRTYNNDFFKVMGYQAPEERRASIAARRDAEFPDE